MLDFGWSEILIIAIVLIVVVGPKDLPRVLRSFGRTTAKLRTMAGDFRRQFDEALREAELDEVKDLVDDVRKLDPRNEIKKQLSPLEQAGRDIRSGLEQAAKPKASSPAPNGSAPPAVETKAPEPEAPKAEAATPAPAPATSERAKRSAAKPAAKKAAAGSKPASKGKTASGKAAPRKKKTMGTAP